MRKAKAGILICILLIFTFPRYLAGLSVEDHVVQFEELQSGLLAESSARQEHLEEIRRMLSSELVQKHFGGVAGLDEIETGLASLDDQTLAELAEQSREVNDQVTAGVSSWVIVIAVGVVLLVILLLI